MNEITKIKVDGEPESSYKLFPKNREFEKRAGGNTGSQSSVQSDWNQNDSTAADYVKNRPFYTNNYLEMIMEETTVEFTKTSGIYSSIGSYDFHDILAFGETYQVTWDGTTYECTCAEFEGEVVLGNLSIQGIGLDTGEPFCFGFGYFYTQDNSASHTISIVVPVEVIEKIDKKYIPELQYMNEVNPTGTGSFSLNRKLNTTVGIYSFAECSETTASGWGSHAEGYDTTASGENSHSEGCGTIAYGKNQHVQGAYNIDDSSHNYAHIVGNGTDDDARSNAHTLDWSGNAWFAGTIEGKALILPSSTEGSTKRFKITVNDSGTLTATEVT